jgi:hypothetical protein
MFMPWVGPAYQLGGVCVVGLNLRYGGGDRPMGSEYRIAAHQDVRLREGRNPHGSRWARSTMAGAIAVLRAGAGGAVTDDADDDELADTLARTARLQAVKCSPAGGRSSPTAAMQRNCPARFLAAELEVLRPGALLVYGRAAANAVARIGTLELVDDQRRFQRATVRADGWHGEAFMLTHPAHGSWYPAQRALLASLAAKPPVLS